MNPTVIEIFYGNLPDATPKIRILESQLAQLAPFFDKCEGGRFLDIGCNNGEKARLIANLIECGHAIGADFIGGSLSLASKHNVLPVATDLNQAAFMPFADASFDCIHAGEIIEHTFSPDLLLKEVARLLKPNGYAVITTPNLASWRNRLVLMLGWQPFDTEVSTECRVGNPLAPRGSVVGHIRMFTPSALAELVARHNLQVERLGGRISAYPSQSVCASILALLDRGIALVRPSLCDGIVIKVRRSA